MTYQPEGARVLRLDTLVVIQPRCFFWGSMSREVATAICDLVLTREDLFPKAGIRHAITNLAELLRALPDPDTIDPADGSAWDDYQEEVHRLMTQVFEEVEFALDELGDSRYTDGQWFRRYDHKTAADLRGLWAICEVLARYATGYLWITTEALHMHPDRVWLWQFTGDGRLTEQRFIGDSGDV